MSNTHSKLLSETGEPIQGAETMKMAKKMLVLAIVATGTLMGSTGTSSALADVGGHLLVQNTGTVNPNGKKGTKKTSASRKRRSVRARNAERRRQRQLKREHERFMAAIFVVAVEEGDAELAMEAIDELGNGETGGILRIYLCGKLYAEIGPPDYNGPDKNVYWQGIFRPPVSDN